LQAKERAMQVLEVKADRQPWFCSGCPHNTSTKVPEGSRAMAGIGCHFMSIWMDRATVGFTQMGGEGVPWMGQQPFSNEQHVFANLGDGTYFHSGSLAIRQSIAAGVNIAYKILYNDAVAMTGGQQVGERPEGHSVLQIAQSMRAEGVVKCVVVTDEPDKYAGLTLAEGVTVHHRDELDRIQREFREVKGTTVIIYDQTCATEKRRRRKRGSLVDPAVRVVINELVCEGCGDCSVQSNCLSVEPLETEFGRKRQINQSTCNKDFSCVKGFCPSFVTVEGGQLKKKSKAAQGAPTPAQLGALPEPMVPALGGAQQDVWGIVVAGVGGTGVITIGQLLGVAAHLDGKGVVTQDAGGLAQKGGATWSHVLIGVNQEVIRTTRVSMAAADLIMGCDPIVTMAKETVLRMAQGRTRVALNSHSTPTAGFVKDGNWQNPAQACAEEIVKCVGADAVGSFNADAAAVKLMGDSLYTNPMMLGYAWQKGWVPLSRSALLRAIELNAVAVEQNKTAFEWGRQAAHNWRAVEDLLDPGQVIEFKRPPSLDALVARRVEFLTAYQNAAYAQDYVSFVNEVRQAEMAGGTSLPLSEAVAKNLFKLMAYKDEYEVARLHTDAAFHGRIGDLFEGDYRLHYHLAPPLLAKKNDKGELQKSKFGPATLTLFKLLAPLKVLRGSAFDVFGYSDERRQERALIAEYRACVRELLSALGRFDDGPQVKLALEIARVPEQIKGFGHVKARHLAAARQNWAALLARFRAASPERLAA
jgi:indolepyruvate ferredoxin oxidoreductase